jgi:hypothetical protein
MEVLVSQMSKPNTIQTDVNGVVMCGIVTECPRMFYAQSSSTMNVGDCTDVGKKHSSGAPFFLGNKFYIEQPRLDHPKNQFLENACLC